MRYPVDQARLDLIPQRLWDQVIIRGGLVVADTVAGKRQTVPPRFHDPLALGNAPELKNEGHCRLPAVYHRPRQSACATPALRN